MEQQPLPEQPPRSRPNVSKGPIVFFEKFPAADELLKLPANEADRKSAVKLEDSREAVASARCVFK